MKKVLAIALSALLAATMSVSAFAFEEGVDYAVTMDDGVAFDESMYPGSLDWDWEACTTGSIITGTVICGLKSDGTSVSWGNSGDTGEYAVDGDTATYFDPFEATTNSWFGIIADQAYELTEIRIYPRDGQLARYEGAAVQGSNDGENWATIFYSEAAADTSDYIIITSDMMLDHGGYSMFRYINLNGIHGDIGELELYGNPAAASEVSADATPVILLSDMTNFYEEVETFDAQSTSVDGSIVGTVIGGGGSYSDSGLATFAWDGDFSTYFDPSSQGGKSWTGIKTEEAYVLTKIAVCPRADNFARTEGACIQGSNDGGATWETIYQFTADQCLSADNGDEQGYITIDVTSSTAYTMFRYANETQWGDVADIALYGTVGTVTETAPATETATETTTEAAAETTETTTTTTTTTTSAQTFDAVIIAAAAAIVSVGTAVVIKKKH